MNIFRGIVASIFIIVFVSLALAVVVGSSVNRAVTPQTATVLVERSRAGERLSAVLPGIVKEDLSSPASQLRIEDIRRITAEALPADQVDSLLKPFLGETMEYIRGERNTVTTIDLASAEKRAEAAVKKIVPGMVGTQFALMIQAQFKTAGLDKGLGFPREQLDAARKAYSQFEFAMDMAAAALVIVFILIFAIAPHGLSGRMRWSGAAFVVVGCLSAAVASCLLAARAFVSGLSLAGNAPPEIKDLLTDAIAAFAGILSKNIYISAAFGIGVGMALIIFGYFLRKRAVAPESFSGSGETGSLQP